MASYRHNQSPSTRYSSSEAHELYQLPRDAPRGQEHSPILTDSLKSADYINSLKTMNHSLQSMKTVQSMDSLKTAPKTDQAAQEEHRAATKAKSSTAHETKSAQVSW